MNSNKRFISVLLAPVICAAFLFFTGCFGGAEKGFKFPASQWEGGEKNYEGHGIKAQYPASWESQSHAITGGSVAAGGTITIPCHRVSFFAGGPGFTGFAVGVSIQPESYSPTGDFGKLKQVLLEEIRGYGESKILFIKDLDYGDYGGFDIVFRWKEHPMQEFFFQDWLRFIRIDSTIAYCLSYNSTDKDFEKFLPEAKFIIESVRFVDTAGKK